MDQNEGPKPFVMTWATPLEFTGGKIFRITSATEPSGPD